MKIYDLYSDTHFNFTDLPMDQELKDLYHAIWDGSFKKTKRIVKNALKRYRQYPFTDDVLFQAISMGHEDIAKFLIKSGADLNAMTPSGHSALMISIEHELEGLARYMFLKGADVNFVASNGTTPLHSAIRKGMPSLAHRFLEKMETLDREDPLGRSSLFYALYNGDFKTANALLERGVDVNRCDKLGISPLMVSINPWVVKSLHHILETNFHEMDPSFELLGQVLPPFKNQDPATVEKLIDMNAKLYAKDRFGNTSLMIAALSGNLEIVKLLVFKNAELDAKDNTGATALLKAVHRGNHEVVKYLLQSGADPNQQKLNKASSLQYAIDKKDAELVKLLLSHGADPNLQDVVGQSPFQLAVLHNWLEGTKLLVGFGADVNTVDREGKTILDYVKANGFKEIEGFLKSFDIPTTESTYEHLFLFTSIEDGPVSKDIAHAYCVIANDGDKRTILSISIGSPYEEAQTPELRKLIISCNNSQPNEFFVGTEKAWFYHAEFAGEHLVKETKLAETNEFNKLVPKDVSAMDYDLTPPNVYDDEFHRLSQFLFSFVDYDETLNGPVNSGQRLGRFIFTGKGNEAIGEGHLIMNSLASTIYTTMISDICEDFFVK
jgi:ankyrin repeat protein